MSALRPRWESVWEWCGSASKIGPFGLHIGGGGVNLWLSVIAAPKAQPIFKLTFWRSVLFRSSNRRLGGGSSLGGGLWRGGRGRGRRRRGNRCCRRGHHAIDGRGQ